MQAVVKTAPADGVAGTEVRDCPLPKAGPEDVLIRVAAAGVCGTDKHIYHWDPSIRDRVVPPRIYGHEFCGFVDALGNAVHTTQVCDLAGKTVAITGFGAIGAMAASVAEQSGASTVIVSDVNDHALEVARRWAAARSLRNFHAFNTRSDAAA